MGDGVNKSSIRVLGQLASILPKREAPAGGGHATSVASDSYVRKDGSADMQALAAIVADLEARIGALEDKVSDLYDEETYAPVPLGQLARNGGAANNAPAVNTAPAINNAPPVNNAPAIANAPAVNNAPAVKPAPVIDIDVLPATDDDLPVAQAAPVAANAEPTRAATYTVKKGDTLWSIAGRELGDPMRFGEIARANEAAYPSLASNPDLIQPGWQLALPTGGRATTTIPARPSKPGRNPNTKPAYDKPALNDRPQPSDDDVIVAKPAKPTRPARKPKQQQAEPRVVVPEVLPPEEKAVAKATKPAKPAPKTTSDAPVPIDMTGVKLAPGADWDITNQQTKVTGVGTETDTHWEVGPDGKAKATDQQTQITDADTNTKTRWEAPAPGKKPAAGGNVAAGSDAPVPIDMNGITIDPLTGFEIAAQETRVEAVETNTDTHWEVEGGKAKATDQQTQVTAADTITRTRWVAKGSVTQKPIEKPPVLPPAPKPLADAEAVAWLRAHIGKDGRISRKELEGMPAGPGRDALLAHFDALLFGYIDPGQEGWVDLHEGDLARLEKALADGGSIAGLAGQLTKWVHADRQIGDLNRDGQKNEADVAVYAGRLRAGKETPTPPAPPAPPAATTGDARLQADLAVYLKNHKGSGDVVHLMKTNPRYIAAATIPQKAQLIQQALAGISVHDDRSAAEAVLNAATERGELLGVLNQLHERKKLDDLFSNLAGHSAGERMAKLFAEQGIYKNSGVVKEMTSQSVSEYIEALGWKHPMIGTSDDLRALPEGNKRAMMQKLLSGEFTQTEHRQATWINAHLDAPITVPRYDPFSHR